MSITKWWLRALLTVVACFQLVQAITTDAKPIQFPDLYEASVLELQEGLDAGHFSSVDLVKVRGT